MSVIDNSTRFVLVEKPLTYPHYDIVSKTPEGPLFDLGIDLEYFNGVVYIKTEHVEEMAGVLGMLSKDKAKELYARNAELEARIEQLSKVEEFVNDISGYVSAYSSGSYGHSSSDTSVDYSESTGEPFGDSEGESGILGSSADESEALDEFFGGDNGQAGSNSGDKGPDKLPASSGNEFGFGS